MRRLLIAISLLLAACGPARKPEEFRFPASVGRWTLTQTHDIPPAGIPDKARGLGLKRAQSAEYSGPGKLDAKLYEFTSDASALEMEQTWKPAADTVAFHDGPYFIAIHWENAPRDDVSAFVRDMEKRLAAVKSK